MTREVSSREALELLRAWATWGQKPLKVNQMYDIILEELEKGGQKNDNK